jgi:RNA polymerase sigma-70 factor (ECF subfamily)
MTVANPMVRRAILGELPNPVLSIPRSFSTLTVTGVPLEHAEFDAGYLARLKDGDAGTEEHFTAYFSNVIWLKLRHRVRARHLIDEIRQETFTRVLNYLKSGKAIAYPERFGGFVLSVCNNVMLEVLRGESQQRPASGKNEEPRDDRVKVEDDIVTGERKRMVREVLAELPEKDRALLRMVFLEEGDREAISRHFQVDTDYLRVLLHRAKERFREVVRSKGVAAGLP